MTLGYRNESDRSILLGSLTAEHGRLISMAISRDFWTKDINRLVQDAGEDATVCLKMADGSKHYIRSILHTGEQEVQTHAHIGGTSGSS